MCHEHFITRTSGTLGVCTAQMKIANEMEVINAFDYFMPGSFLYEAITGGLLPEIFRAGEIILPEFSPTWSIDSEGRVRVSQSTNNVMRTTSDDEQDPSPPPSPDTNDFDEDHFRIRFPRSPVRFFGENIEEEIDVDMLLRFDPFM